MARTFFKKIFMISLFAATTACNSSAVMTRGGFNEIELGTPIQTVVKEHGEPYSIQSNNDGSKEYLYIERLPVGDEVVEENSYYLVVKDGKVISKRYKQELPPPYDEMYDEDPNDVPN